MHDSEARKTLIAAIEKLTAERDQFDADLGWTPSGLLTTLYDTIDEQLAILRDAVNDERLRTSSIVEFARAIL